MRIIFIGFDVQRIICGLEEVSSLFFILYAQDHQVRVQDRLTFDSGPSKVFSPITLSKLSSILSEKDLQDHYFSNRVFYYIFFNFLLPPILS